MKKGDMFVFHRKERGFNEQVLHKYKVVDILEKDREEMYLCEKINRNNKSVYKETFTEFELQKLSVKRVKNIDIKPPHN